MSVKSWWHKQGPGKKHAWWVMKNGEHVDWNEAFVKIVRTTLEDFAADYSDAELIRLFWGNRDAIALERQRRSSEPWADLQYIDGKITVKSFNKAFAQKIRDENGDVTTEDMSDEDVVKLYVDRENIEQEPPRLEILHEGIEPDGQLKIKLDWNQSFIRHLADNGITGETEEEAVELYLGRLMTKINDEEGTPDDVLNRDLVSEAFRDIDVVAEREMNEAAEQLKKPRRRRMT